VKQEAFCVVGRYKSSRRALRANSRLPIGTYKFAVRSGSISRPWA